MPIARHYWKNGENATWVVNPDFPADVLEWIKVEYGVLSGERVRYKELGNRTLFFDYQDNQDVFGRDHTEITIACSEVLFAEPTRISIKVCADLVGRDIASLDFQMDISDDDVRLGTHSSSLIFSRGSEDSRIGYLLGIGLVLIVAIAVTVYLWVVSKPDDSLQAASFSDTTVLSVIQKNENHSASNVQKEAEQSKLVHACDSSIVRNWNSNECLGEYLQARCRGYVSGGGNVTLTYESWTKKRSECRRPKGGLTFVEIDKLCRLDAENLSAIAALLGRNEIQCESKNDGK